MGKQRWTNAVNPQPSRMDMSRYGPTCSREHPLWFQQGQFESSQIIKEDKINTTFNSYQLRECDGGTDGW